MRKLVVAIVLAAVMFGGMGTGVAFAHPPPAVNEGGVADLAIGVPGVPGFRVSDAGWVHGIGDEPRGSINDNTQAGLNIVAHNPLCMEHEATH